MSNERSSASEANETLAAMVAGADAVDAVLATIAQPVLSVIFFRVGARWFGVPAGGVREVVTKGFITRVPTAPHHVVGVALVRGRLVPVVAFEELIGPVGSAEAAPTLPRLLILADGDQEIAVVADETRGVIEHGGAAAPTESRRNDRPGFVSDEIEWQGRLVCLLDVAALNAACLRREEGRP